MNLIIYLIFLLPSFCFGANPFEFKEKPFNLKIGVDLRVQTNIRTGNTSFLRDRDPIVAPLPFARFKLGHLEIEPDKARLYIFKNFWGDFNLRGHYMGHDYNATDMSHRHSSVYTGFGARFLIFKFKYLRDVSGVSDARVTIVSAILPFHFGDSTTLIFQGDIETWDDNYVNYYFGVKPEEVRDGRPEYLGKEEDSYRIKGTFFTKVSKNWILKLEASYRKYGKNIGYSPTVKRNNEKAGVIGWIYEFL